MAICIWTMGLHLSLFFARNMTCALHLAFAFQIVLNMAWQKLWCHTHGVISGICESIQDVHGYWLLWARNFVCVAQATKLQNLKL